MNESTRQLKVARLVQKELAEYLRARSIELAPGSMISVTMVRVSPDMAQARVYLSVFPSAQSLQVLKTVSESTKSIRYELGKKVGQQLRHIPELHFFLDDSMDYAERIDELLKP